MLTVLSLWPLSARIEEVLKINEHKNTGSGTQPAIPVTAAQPSQPAVMPDLNRGTAAAQRGPGQGCETGEIIKLMSGLCRRWEEKLTMHS